ncbi:MAG: hypothetical protein C0408_00635 [Odoribacter sp.]|nr:hypothetical protein [Odoribacter sp.]
MKKILLLSAVLILFAITIRAQDPEFEYYKNKEIRTLLGRNRAGGGYGSFTMGYSIIDNKNAVLMGGRFSWIASHSIGVGIGGTGFMNEFHYEPSIGRQVFLAGGYGGIYIEPILLPRSPVHLSFPVLFGAGGISYISTDPDFHNHFVEDSEVFLLIEPSAELELNLTRFFRLAFGASYRYPTAFNVGLSGTPTANAESIRGMSYTVTLKFGKF